MNLFTQLICAARGHRYVVEKRLSDRCRKVGCTRCGKSWAMNDDVQSLLPWDDEFEQMAWQQQRAEFLKRSLHGWEMSND